MMESVPRRSLILLAAGLWLVFLATNPGRNETVDAGMRLAVAHQMWERREVTFAPGEAPAGFNWIKTRDGRFGSYFNLGQSLLFVPFDFLGSRIAQLANAEGKLSSALRWMPIGFGLLPALGVVWWWLMITLLREMGLEPRWALLAATATIVGTIAFYYVGSDQQVSLNGSLLTAAVVCALRWTREARWRSAVGAGFFVGCGLLTRVDFLAGSIVVVALMACGRLSRKGMRFSGLAAAALSALPPVLVMMTYSWVRFGNLYATGYARKQLGAEWIVGWRTPLDFVALLVGPGKGLLILSPIVLLAFFGIRDLKGRVPLFALSGGLALLSSLLLSAGFPAISDGAWSWGCRFQVYLMSLLAVPLGLAARRFAGSRGGRRTIVWMLGLSTLIQILSVLAPCDLEYEQIKGARLPERTLITSVRHGQIELRTRNILNVLVDRPPVALALAGSDAERRVRLIWSRYLPNFWGPAYSKRTSPLAARGILLLWGSSLLGGVLLLAKGLSDTWRGTVHEGDPAGTLAEARNTGG